MSQTIMGYWVNFAKKGDPNGSGLPAWPAFDAKSQQAMVLDDRAVSAKTLPNLPELAAWDDYFSWRRAEIARRAAK